MSVLEIIDTLLFKPLQLIFEIIWAIANRLIDNPGGDIVALSLAMNFLVLPLYMRADAMQEEERRMEELIHKGVAHIKKTFSGDEQMMMMRTYYRQNNYKPLYVLRGAVPLFLEIPFFIAAYRFLSGLQMLNGVSFGPVPDLGKPDGLLQAAGLSINILPIIMTAVNMVSCLLFTKGSPLKTKLQLYGMALFFLIFLYSSPSGLVFYWTLNNIFSLIKTIFYKLKNPRKIINIISASAGVGTWIYGFFIFTAHTPKLAVFFAAAGMLMQFPAVSSLLKKRGLIKAKTTKGDADAAVFLSGGLFLSVLAGALIPSAVIKSSPHEFVAGLLTDSLYHPTWNIIGAFCMAFGIFVVWAGVFYRLAAPSVKLLFDRGIWIISGIAVIDYMLFNKSFGNLSAYLKYENELAYTFAEQMFNLIILAAAAIMLYVIYKVIKHRIYEVLIIGTIAMGIMTISNICYINSSIGELNIDKNAGTPEFTLSRNGKNVVVIMLDRALGELVPYIFEEKPELKAQFDGFTYYSNTISFGGYTNFGSPALLGGYEYTPVEMNKRDSEPLVEKHNEALKVMPVLFDENGYEVTVVNPVYANYRWIPDLTIYDDYPDIKRFYDMGEELLSTQSGNVMLAEDRKRNFFCYSLLKTMPTCVSGIIYDDGRYNQPNDIDKYYEQHFISGVAAEGISKSFMGPYKTLESLSDMSSITDDDANTFMLMVNDTTHEPMMLQAPDYVPAAAVDNTEYEENIQERVFDGRTLHLDNGAQMAHYHINMAAMIQLGRWFDYMRKEGVYDNTRIILVSDHGSALGILDELSLNDDMYISAYYPLLMVKDFGSSGFNTSDEFMTNGDVPSLAVDGIIENPVNPFTGKMINSDEKTAHDQYIINSDEQIMDINNGNTFLPSDWYSVHDNIWDKSNWERVAEDAILPVED